MVSFRFACKRFETMSTQALNKFESFDKSKIKNLQIANQIFWGDRWFAHESAKLFERQELIRNLLSKLITREQTHTAQFVAVLVDHHGDLVVIVHLLKAEQVRAFLVGHLEERGRQVFALESNQKHPKAGEKREVVVEQSGRMLLDDGEQT